MSSLLLRLSLFYTFISLVFAYSTVLDRRDTNNTLPNHVVTQFSRGTWIENLAVRSNGDLILTSVLPNASLYQVCGPDTARPSTSLLFTIPQITSIVGIAETSADVFVFAGGNLSLSGGITAQKGSWGLYEVDLRQDSPRPKLVVELPDALFLNGLTIVPQKQNLVLIADSFLEKIWRVNLTTRKVEVAATLARTPSAPNNVGVNGIKIHDGYLWYTNSTAFNSTKTGKPETAMYRFKVDDYGGPAPGAEIEVATVFPTAAVDDFVFGPGNSGIRWVATNTGNIVFAVESDGREVEVAGGPHSDEVPTATACQFGRTRGDSHILYVTTGGVLQGTTPIGAKVQAVDTLGFHGRYDI